MTPPTSEAIAKQANIEIKPDQPPTVSPASETPAEASKEVKEPVKEAVKEVPMEPLKEAPKETPREAMKEAPAAVAEAAMPEPAAKPAPKMTASEAPREAKAQESKAAESKAPESKAPEFKATPEVKAPESKSAGSAAVVSARRDSEGLHLTFGFTTITPAALFRRADAVWLLFDTNKPVDVEPIRSNGGALIAEVTPMALDKGQAVRIRLNRPQMPSLTGDDRADGSNWVVTFADTMQTPTQQLIATRNVTDPAKANVTIPISRPGLLYKFTDPDAGDALMVITATAPVRGFIKRQDFVEMSLLETIHGVAIHPNSDDITAEIATDKIILGRPGGLTLSSANTGGERAPTLARPIFDDGEWRKSQEGIFNMRLDALIEASASADPEQRTPARINLARFYLAREMYPEAKAILDLALIDAKPGTEDPVVLITHAVAAILMGRPEIGMKDLANPAIGTNYDSQLWKALAYTRTGKWAEAREKFKNVEFAINSLPIELQRIVIYDALRSTLEVKDYSGADKRANELQIIGPPTGTRSAFAVMRGRIAEALGRDKDALDEYQKALDSDDRPAAAEATLLQIALKQKRDEITTADALAKLETQAITWRGDGLEVQTLGMLSHLYVEAGRYADTFAAARTATRLQPNSEISRRSQDEASALFAQLFLSQKGDDLPPIDALGMFYDYRELTPIGRRGDEMIRRLPIAWSRSICSIRPANSCNTRSTSGWRVRRGRRSPRAWRWCTSPTASPTAPSPHFAPPASPISPANYARSGCCWRRALRATSGAMTSRSISSRISAAAKRSGCAPIFSGRRGTGARRPNRSNCITRIAGATSNR